MGKKRCKWCNEPYRGAPVYPSDWGFFKREAYSHCSDDAIGNRCYCSEKCRAEAEATTVREKEVRDETEDDYSSTSSSSSEGGWIETVLGLLILVAIAWGGWRGYKWLFGSENGADSRAMSAVKGFGNKAKSVLLDDDTKEKKDSEAELKRLNTRLAELEGDVKTNVLKQSSVQKPETSSRKSSKTNAILRGNEVHVKVFSEGQTRSEAWQEAFRTAVQSAVRGFVGDHKLLSENKDKFEECLDTVGKDDVKRFSTLKDVQEGGIFTVGIEARFNKEEIAPKFAKIFPDVFAMPTPGALTRQSVPAPMKHGAPEASTKSSVPTGSVGANGAANGQPNGTGRKATKDSKVIRIVVQGKGKTKASAVRWALREAVFRTTCTWVDSKVRIQENREKIVAKVNTITEADVLKFEVLETQEKDGGFVVRMSVSVSKRKIAPKFAEIFPDVFVIE